MRGYVVWRDRMSVGISEIWIMLIFQQGLRKCSVRLVHPDQNGLILQCASSDLEVSALFRCGEFNTASRENTQHRVGVPGKLNEVSEKLTRAARPHCLFAYTIKSLQ